ncbi:MULTISPECIES: endo-1,4-beta-xylanase [unclassified Fibrobacter]|uniref:endo-1,4-beta-xylanase n=1 Tax=unclassified Fibrobacter TaxID=2634177 RepID=UPI000D6B678E|nr:MULTISPECIES: endo-1,4-beta-xylanase [unclassified Fibrobacter]PWJ68308.1 GH35 family endo-1,4-beta-xylanase [Fibrobacter sp. UWR4]PZW65642.1 GH35 family endo-1,4-beta-xylanase [Fibrobacter sp. UWR1]
MKKHFANFAAGLALAASCAVPAVAGPGIADGAAKFIGNITQSNTAPGPNDQFTQLWNQATAENGCKWGSIEGTRGKFNWAGCDAAYNWAKNNGGHFKFHALLWGGQYPGWLESLSVDETKKAITTWFDAVKAHYPDLEMIDVANEAIRTGNGQYHSGYTRTKIIPALGGDNNGDYAFLTTAFKMARERWPKAILIYNDYNTIQWHVDQGINLINTIRKNGAPVDAYGLQAHDLMSDGGQAGGTGGGGVCMNYNNFVATMQKIHKETNNFPVLISEYDVPSTDDGIQKQCYSEQVKYWMEDPYVAGITIWGWIYGQTWLNCNGKANGCSGLVRNGQDRPALTWMKEYLKNNKGVNATGLATGITAEPEPQTPFKGSPLAIPGIIQMEDFDIPGVGSGNDSYGDADFENHGDSDYRKDTGVDLYKKSNNRIVVGYNNEGDWLEYTVNVAETGTYTVYAAVAAAGSTSSFQLSMDGKAISEKIAVPAAASGEDNYDDYNKVAFDVNLTQGKHILRFTVTGAWLDIDYMNIVAKGEADPNPIEKSSSSVATDPNPESSSSPIEGGDAIRQGLNFEFATRQDFDIFDMQGTFMGRIGAYSFGQAISFIKDSDVNFAKGVYYIRNKNTKQMHSFRITE